MCGVLVSWSSDRECRDVVYVGLLTLSVMILLCVCVRTVCVLFLCIGLLTVSVVVSLCVGLRTFGVMILLCVCVQIIVYGCDCVLVI